MNPSYGRNTVLLSDWLKEKVQKEIKKGKPVSDIVKWLSYGPVDNVMSYSGFLVSGCRFHTKHVSTQNSGVSLEAKAVRESESNENASVAGSNAYYGVLWEIFVLDYHAFQIPMFMCDWASIDRGVKVEDGFTLVNLH